MTSAFDNQINTDIDDDAFDLAWEQSVDYWAAVIRQLIELSWSGGFVDGEACIHISKTTLKGRLNPTYRLIVTLSQNHRRSLERLAKALKIPSKFYRVKRRSFMNRDVDVLNISDQHAYRCLKLLLPFLCRKKPEAQVAIAAYEAGKFDVHPGCAGHDPEVWAIRERAYKKLKRMK